MDGTNKTLILLALCCVANLAHAADEPTPEDIARYNALMQERQATIDMSPYARSTLALNTNAPYVNRLRAIETFVSHPEDHLDALDILLAEPDWGLRFTAIDVIEPIRTDLAYQAARQLVQEASQTSNASPHKIQYALWAGALMARMGDGSAMPYIVQRLHHAPLPSYRDTALCTLYSFYYLKALKPYEPVVAYIDQILPDLKSSNEHTRNALRFALPI